MKKLFLFTFFFHLVPTLLVSHVRALIAAILANATDFPTPKPTLSEMTSAVDNLSALVAEAALGTKAAIVARDAQRLAVLNMIRSQFLYLESCCDGDRVMGAKLGIPMTRIPSPTPPINYVSTPVITNGPNPGQLIAEIEAVKHRQLYNYRITDDPTKPVSEWKSYPWKKIKFMFENLTSGVAYTICVEAWGKDGQMVCSEHITRRAL